MRRTRQALLMGVCLAALALIASLDRAAAETNRYWTGGGSSGNWSDPGNWSGGVPNPSAWDDIYFDSQATGTLNTTNDIDYGGSGYNSLTVASTCPSDVTIGGSTALSVSLRSLTDNIGIDMSAATHNLSITAPCYMATDGYNVDWNVNGGTTLSFGNAVLGYRPGRSAGTVTKKGAGTVVLGGGASDTTDNSNLILLAHEGTVQLNKGSVLDSNSAVNTINAIDSGATVQYTGTGDYQVWAHGSIFITGGTLDLNGHNQLGSNNDAHVSGVGSTLANTAAGTSVNFMPCSVPTSGADVITVNGNLAVNAVGDIAIGNRLVDLDSTHVGSLSKIGGGTLYLNRINDYTGPTTVSEGTLALNFASPVINAASAVSVQSGATLRVDKTAALGGSTLSADPTVTVANGGLVTTSNGVASCIGNLNLQGGTLAAGTPLGTATHETWILLGDVNVSGGVTSTMSASSMALSSGGGVSFFVDAGSTLNVTGSFASAAETSDPDNGLVKRGDGLMVMSGANTYASGTQIRAGTLQIGVNNALPTNTTVTLGAATTGGILDLAGHNQQVAGLLGAGDGNFIGNSSTTDDAVLTFNSSGTAEFASVIEDAIGGVGTHKTALSVTGGTLILDVVQNYTGATTVSNGTLALNYAYPMINAASAVSVQTGGTLRLDKNNALGGSNTALIPTVTVSSGGLLTTSDHVASCISNLNLQGGTLASGAPLGTTTHETWILEGDVSATGATPSTISATSMALQKTGGVTFTVAGGSTLNVTGDFASASQTSDPDNGLIKDGGGLMVLGANNTYTSATTIKQGTLALAAGGSILSSAVIHVNAGAIYDVSAKTSYAVGGGQTLEGSGSIHGAVTIADGATLAPGGSIGTLTFDNTLSLAGITSMEIDKTGSLLTSDLVQGVTTLTFGGALDVTATGDPIAAGDSWKLFDAVAYAGNFASLNLPTLGSGLAWNTSHLSLDGTLSVVSVPEPGTLALLAAGLMGLLAYAWRKRK